MARMVRFVLFTLIGLFSVAPAMADQPFTVSGGAAIKSEYLLDNMRKASNEPVVQGFIDLTHASGIYAEIWGSIGIPGNHDDGAREVDLTVGYSGTFGEHGRYRVRVSDYLLSGSDVMSYGATASVDTRYGVGRVELEFLDPMNGYDPGWMARLGWTLGRLDVSATYTDAVFGNPALLTGDVVYTIDHVYKDVCEWWFSFSQKSFF